MFKAGNCGDAQSAAPLRVLFVASEIHPLIKTGGLADVCAALPRALADRHVDVRLLMPAYPAALEAAVAMRTEHDLGEVLGEPARLLRARMPDSDLPVWLVDSPGLFRRGGDPYQDEQGRDWPDNAWRFGVFAHVAARLALGRTPVEWQPDIVHCHDWHTGLVPLLLRHGGQARPRSLFTVHNAAFHGSCALDTADALQLPLEVKGMGGAEFHGQLSFLKAGVRYADRLTTVSPTYARELQTTEFGMGLDGLFRARANDLAGIMNGIDDEAWNPAFDPELAQRYSPEDRGGKDACKSDLQQRLGLRIDPRAPLTIFASRVTQQKMADTLLHSLPAMMARHPRMQFALLGRGDRELEQGFTALAAAFPGRASVRIGYAEACARRLHAGADLLLHGARFEPCGLVQQYALRYGTLPVVRRVGGLADSVIDAREHDPRRPNGFVFDEACPTHFEAAVERSVDTYEQRPDQWRALQDTAMSADWSWNRAADAYLEVYKAAVPWRHAAHAAPMPPRLAPMRPPRSPRLPDNGEMRKAV